MFFSNSKKNTPESLYYAILELTVAKGGLISTSDIKKFRDPDFFRTILNKMTKDGVITAGIIDRCNMEYIFPALPVKYMPESVSTTDEFFSMLTEMGKNADDGHIFISEIIFAFRIYYDDIIEALGIYCGSDFVSRHVSGSGNIYLVFDKNVITGQK